MGLTSLQVCMDSSDWLQGTLHEDSAGMDSSSPLSNDMLTCSRPLNMERRLRPQHDHALKCPRCDSTHTKFCYYNNYSLSQPRYFCKTCRRYWTKGGTLRNIPVGGGCRKNKKAASKKPNDNNSPVVGQMNTNVITPGSSSSPTSQNTTDLQLSFPDQVQFSHLTNLLGPHHQHHQPTSFFEQNGPRPIDFMESKLEAIVGNSRNNYDFLGSTNNSNTGHEFGMVGVGLRNLGGTTSHHHGISSLDHHHHHQQPNFHGICPPIFGMSLDGNSIDNGNNNGTFLDTCQRLMLPNYEASHDHDEDQNGIDVKPNAKALLSLDWQDQGCSSDHHAGNKDSFGYLNSLGSWSNVMNNYGPSSTNPLV